MEIKQTASKINSTLLKTKKTKKQSTTVGNGSLAPEEIFTLPTHQRLFGKRKNGKQPEFKKILFNKKTKNNQPPWAMVCQSQKRFSLFQHTGDSLDKGKNGQQPEIIKNPV